MSKTEMKFDESVKLADNAMLTHRPELYQEWNFEKNDEIGLNIYEVSYGSNKKAWWNCRECKSPYDMSINRRTIRESNCPYCRGYRVNQTNSLASLRPDIAKEWHPTKNGNLTPDNVTCGSGKIVWWKCSRYDNHHWSASIDSRVLKDSSCRICTGKSILVGFNDMWTTNPELASMLANSEDGYKYLQGSTKSVDWCCRECSNIIKNKRIEDINRSGLRCPRCSDGVSFGERFLYSLLMEANIDFEYDVAQEWSQGKRYDFYLSEYNWIIEVHGEQHYIHKNRGRSLKMEQENDKLKENLARENGVENYIVIDARESSVKWMKDSILNSDIMSLVGDVDFIKVGGLSSTTLVKTTCDLWSRNKGCITTTDIARKLKINRNTVSRYLKKGTGLGWCDYCPIDEQRKNGTRIGGMNKVSVVRLNKATKSFLEEYESIAQASFSLGVSNKHISAVCRGHRKTAGGYKWMYLEDYEEYIKNKAN